MTKAKFNNNMESVSKFRPGAKTIHPLRTVYLLRFFSVEPIWPFATTELEGCCRCAIKHFLFLAGHKKRKTDGV